ncbi:two-component response regulator-like APRR7 isoform X1 [Pistacia vera]|uniref:two-component response regulator-like APRR7 isoform X1 n=1 Tax=Pistacia vera TaxID=55513 RepID=UPI0012635A57|nr:two-component response regulator-like APRR7 isoform X1 [Pistacia vera]XP_031269192.1 two-component response regulator-like APRR7 isoform X1 [Pistacia vera]XP_031269193.1 two-component response regulator-like APRR7 isoform X1 [Pistacia vera]XP_031269194.1 two-component response regulator-like APRR7 isoform X1 [Pistacia vera]XP_031269195.1 two-component response regulator-like APRR7 isoform X1 [Pistacia vera]XP_031269196.1 two-component response regulator-like APRR7 isoform X1 [Pistacia vera]
MKVDGTRDKELQELNHHLQDGSKRDMVVGEQGSHDDGQLKDNKNAENVKDGCGGTVQASAVLQVSQQQPQAAMVCWERFLHLRSLKVLLVENDDSTRYVVAALLRNCSYEVTEATNGLQAWKILEDLTNHINIVLTEVAMPCLSGIGLLCKIMNHKTRKNVPVIMMSSLDSISLVFKCFSKGAVDFLVKPIRKNELKNLWQHVWRRCHSSSGSGSESGTQTQKSVKSKSVEKSDNNTGSNDEEDNGSIGLNVGDGSDDGSGTQSSWTKQVKFDGPGPISPCGQVAECPDSTCAQVIHLNAEVSDNRRIPVTEAEECHEHEEKLDNISMGRDLNLGVHRGLDLQLEYSSEVPIKCVGTKQNNHLEVDSSKFFEPIDRGQLDLKSESPSSKMKYEAANLIGVITKITDPEKNNAEYEAQNRISEILDDNSKVIKDSVELPSLELSLKRLRGVKDIGMTVQVDRNVLRRSDSSAFSRYNATSNTNKGPGGNVASASQVDNSLEVAKKGAICDIQSHSSGDILHQSLNAGSNNMDLGSTTNNAFIKPVLLKNKSEVSSTINRLNQSYPFQPMKNNHLCGPHHVASDKGESVMAASSLAQPWDEDQELQIQHLTHHYDNCHHLIYNLQQQQLPHDHDLLSLKKMAATVPHCGSSNALGGLVEGNARNHSVNGSTSGSNHGSNGQNGSSTAMNAGGMNIESDNGVADKSESGDASGSGCGTGSGSGSGSRVDQNKFSQREAALTKFRQKRKERCYRKRVRYQSRKRLAEQRLGQFVRQTANKNTSRDADS